MSVINRMLHDLDARGVRHPASTAGRMSAAAPQAALPRAHRLPDDHAWSTWRRTTLWTAVLALAVGTWVLGPPWIESMTHRPADAFAAGTGAAPAAAEDAGKAERARSTPNLQDVPVVAQAGGDATARPAAADATTSQTLNMDPAMRHLPSHRSAVQAPDQGQRQLADSRGPAAAVARTTAAPVYVAPGLPPMPGRTPPAARADGGMLAANAKSDLFTLVSPPAAGRPQPTAPAAVLPPVKPAGSGQRAMAALQQAQDLVDEGHAADALEAARAAVRLDPSHAEARRLAIQLALETGELSVAMTLIDDGLRRNPQDTDLGVLRARQLLAQGRPDEALAALQSLPRLSPEAHGLKAGLLANGGNYPQAIAAYEQALRLRPTNATWWLGLGVALDNQGRALQARQAYARARALGSLRPDVAAWVDQKLQ